MDKSQEDIEIVWKDPNDLKAYPRNSRTHSDSQIEILAKSIVEIGFRDPIEIDENDMILVGHARTEAAILNKMDAVPCIVHKNMTMADKRRYIIANNRLAELASWSTDMLKIEMTDLRDQGLNMEIIGYSPLELQTIYSYGEQEQITGAPTPGGTAVSVAACGDIWLLGTHKLVCGVEDLLIVDQLIEKWQSASCSLAVLEQTKESFAEVKKTRLAG